VHPFDDAAALVKQMPNASLVRAHSPLELRLRPRRLTNEIRPGPRPPAAAPSAAPGNNPRRNPGAPGVIWPYLVQPRRRTMVI
jgi:hypothetical protein